MEELPKSPFLTSPDPLHFQEIVALCVLLAEESFKAKSYIKELLKVQGYDYNADLTYKALVELGTDIYPVFHTLVRIALNHRLYTPNTLDLKNGKNASMFSICKVWIPEHIKLFEAEQKEKADKRQASVNKRIAALEKQKSSQTSTAN